MAVPVFDRFTFFTDSLHFMKEKSIRRRLKHFVFRLQTNRNKYFSTEKMLVLKRLRTLYYIPYVPSLTWKTPSIKQAKNTKTKYLPTKRKKEVTKTIQPMHCSKTRLKFQLKCFSSQLNSFRLQLTIWLMRPNLFLLPSFSTFHGIDLPFRDQAETSNTPSFSHGRFQC